MDLIQPGEVLTFEQVDVYTKNFRGDKFAANGVASVGFFISEEAARELEERECPGLKWTKPYDNAPEDWVSRPWIKASIGFRARPPVIYQITSRGGRRLDETTVGNLQQAKIDGPIDVCIRCSSYEVNGETGLKFWVTELYVKIEETPLAAKYAYLMDEDDTEDDD